MFERLFQKKIKLSYGITVCNEAVEFERLILFLLLFKDQQDEIIVLKDSTHKDEWVSRVLIKYRDKLIIKEEKLNNDFATFKNNLISLASGDYLFQIDADEMPAEHLIRTLKSELKLHKDYDCFAVPRVNFVKGLTPEFVDKWKWQIDEKGRVNFPDYQLRIFKLDKPIKWRYRVHEELVGLDNYYMLPATSDDFCLMHIKTIDRQEKQNDFYNSFQ